jgi:hypothetical protein
MGANFATCYFRWRPVGLNDDGSVALEKCVAFVVVRPCDSVIPNGPYARLLAAQGAPRMIVVETIRLHA